MQEQQGQSGSSHPRTCPLVLVHRTHPMYARHIIEHGVFHGNPHSERPGLHAVLRQDARGSFVACNAAAKGARLVFTWDGPVLPMPAAGEALMPNFLYDEHPLRVVVPEGSCEHLRLVDVELEEGYSWADAIETPRNWLGHLKHLMTTSPHVLQGQAIILGQKLETMAMQCQPVRVARSSVVQPSYVIQEA